MNPPKEPFTVTVPVADITDTDLRALAAAIGTNAPNADVVKNNPSIKDTVAAIATMASTWDTSVGVVSADQSKLDTDKTVAAKNREGLIHKIQLLRAQVQDAAPDAAAAQAVGVKTRSGKPERAPLLTPNGGTLTQGKRDRSRLTASAGQVPGIRTYKMQICTGDPSIASNWSDVDGHGKSHVFTGFAVGTRVYVRFAATRGQTQSAWSPYASIVIA